MNQLKLTIGSTEKLELVITLTAHSTYSWMCPICEENAECSEPQEEDRYPHPSMVTCCECLEKYNVTAVEHSDEEVDSIKLMKHKEEIEALKNELEFMTNVCNVRQQTIELLMARLTDARNKLADTRNKLTEHVLQQSDLINKLTDEISVSQEWGLDIYETGFSDAMKQVLHWLDNEEK